MAALGGTACGLFRDEPEVDDTHLRWEPAHTVVVITVDSLSPRILMGETWDWDVAPAMHEVFDEAVLLSQLITPAGTTRPALASMLTGLYPQQHGARTNSSELREGTTLLRRFTDAGYLTFGFTSNQCPIIRDGDVEEYYCTWNDELTGSHSLEERDQLLVDELNARLRTVASDEPVFVWLHLNNVHHPFMADFDLVDSFYGGSYSGFLIPSNDDMVADVTLGALDITPDEQRYLEATYAAQLSVTDGMIDEVLQTLRDLERYDDAIIVLGADHGEELAEHSDYRYFWHGCSPYNSVLRVVYALRAPGRLDAGQVFDGWFSLTDIAPTLVELAGAFPWSGERAGSSLVDHLTGGEPPELPVFSSRGNSSAVMVHEDHKLILSEAEGYESCEPYAGTGVVYPGDTVELYDLVVDPAEELNLASSDTTRADSMHTHLCEWMVEVGWVPADQAETNVLSIQCNAWLCDHRSDACPS